MRLHPHRVGEVIAVQSMPDYTTEVLYRCKRCGEVFTRELDGAWTEAQIAKAHETTNAPEGAPSLD